MGARPADRARRRGGTPPRAPRSPRPAPTPTPLSTRCPTTTPAPPRAIPPRPPTPGSRHQRFAARSTAPRARGSGAAPPTDRAARRDRRATRSGAPGRTAPARPRPRPASSRGRGCSAASRERDHRANPNTSAKRARIASVNQAFSLRSAEHPERLIERGADQRQHRERRPAATARERDQPEIEQQHVAEEADRTLGLGRDQERRGEAADQTEHRDEERGVAPRQARRRRP